MAHPAEYLEFIRLFNEEEFFEAHEVLEGLWHRETGESREFYQGLIQIAALFVHLQRGTPEGAKKLLKTATHHLSSYLPAYLCLNLVKLLSEAEASLLHGSPLPRLSLNYGVD